MGMWLFALLGLAFLGAALAGARRLLPPTIGLLSLGGFFFCLACTILLGYQSRKSTLENRTGYAATSMMIMMASMLKEESDETLERIAEKGGPAGDAASLLLQKRRAP